MAQFALGTFHCFMSLPWWFAPCLSHIFCSLHTLRTYLVIVIKRICFYVSLYLLFILEEVVHVYNSTCSKCKHKCVCECMHFT